MEKIIEKARTLNKDFSKLNLKQKFEFIRDNIDSNVIFEEIQWYYDGMYCYPYDSINLINKMRRNADKFRFEKAKQVRIKLDRIPISSSPLQ